MFARKNTYLNTQTTQTCFLCSLEQILMVLNIYFPLQMIVEISAIVEI